jgi:hypothetical protein
MWIESPAGEQAIRLQFETPLENRIGKVLTMASAGIVLCFLALGYRLRRTLIASGPPVRSKS